MKNLLNKYISALYLRSVLFMLLTAVAVGFVFSFFFPHLSIIPRLLLLITVVLFVADYIMLFSREAMFARRITPERMSNGDENAIRIYIQNTYPFPSMQGPSTKFPISFS